MAASSELTFKVSDTKGNTKHVVTPTSWTMESYSKPFRKMYSALTSSLKDDEGTDTAIMRKTELKTICSYEEMGEFINNVEKSVNAKKTMTLQASKKMYDIIDMLLKVVPIEYLKSAGIQFTSE